MARHEDANRRIYFFWLIFDDMKSLHLLWSRMCNARVPIP